MLLAYIGITFIAGDYDLAMLAGCLVGGCIGFLWFNAFPATIFMGDTGSLGLGGAIAGLAVMTKTEVLLILLGGIFVIEALSVAIQVISFQTTRKRVFLMAPIHHHFELRGWSETKIILRFWIVAVDLLRDRLHASTARASDEGHGGLTARPPEPAARAHIWSSASPAPGVAAALALRARGEEVIGVDAGRARQRSRRSCAAGVELHLDSDGHRAARAGSVGRQEPRRAAAAAVIAAARGRGIPVLGRARARLADARRTSSSP